MARYYVQVATRRTRTAGKVEIPNVDDHVSKLEHMGKETVKKLQDIRTAAVQASVEINIAVNCILKGSPPPPQAPSNFARAESSARPVEAYCSFSLGVGCVGVPCCRAMP